MVLKRVHDQVRHFLNDYTIVVDGLRINENIILLIFYTNQNIFRGAARNSRQVATCYTELEELHLREERNS